MACRKAADRSLMELSDWMQSQSEAADAAWHSLVREQQDYWTPRAVWKDCCPVWLQQQGGECRGGCSLDHPRIVLEWNPETNGATATLTHALDPMIDYFRELCRQGKAISSSSGDDDDNKTRYNLIGFLQEHVDLLQAHTGFGRHLVQVKYEALAASARAHERQVQQEEAIRESKRRKLLSAPTDLRQAAWAVCYRHGLADFLDWAEIGWMRQIDPPADGMARARMQQIKLSYSVLVDGVYCNLGETVVGGSEGTLVPPPNRGNPARYTVRANREALSLAAETTAGDQVPSRFVPTVKQDFAWRYDGTSETDRSMYCGHAVRVYLMKQGAPSWLEKDIFFSSSDRLEVARFTIDPRDNEGVVVGQAHALSSSSGNNCLVYEIVTSSSQAEAETGPDDSPSRVTTGSFRVVEVHLNFEDLRGVYVRKKLPRAKRSLQQTKAQRPVTRVEKDYVKALAKATREAPGSATAFEGMWGW